MKRKMIYGIIVLVVVLPVVLLAVRSALTKAPTDLGVHDGRLAACPSSPNCVSSQAEDADHRIEPLAYEGDVTEAMARLKAAVATIPRTEIVKEDAAYLHVEATSLIFRFVDDVEFLFDTENQVIQVRSASRTGYSDLGANRARVESVRAALEAG